ncbi:MAG TPA: hypothetical protein VGX78_18335 [Pirellulales bacterium]|jgi:hypothetical protein|nr:hypothetical protein [Pirellulales bacterium]
MTRRSRCATIVAAALTVLVLMAAVPATAWVDAGDNETQESERQATVARLAPAKAHQVKISIVGEPSIGAVLEPEPLLRWSNPTAGSVYGEVFLWSHEGRPVAIASIYRWYHPYHDATLEIVSVSNSRVRAEEGTELLWEPQSRGVSFGLFPDAPEPAKSSAARLVQMRKLARRFSAELADERSGEQVTRQLRLLDQPIHRFASEPVGVVDGGLFALVEVTDPELWILIEAADDGEEVLWRYALARMNSNGIDAALDGKLVQSWPKVQKPWKDRKSTYTLFSFHPDSVKVDAPAKP